jgi:hypothetical protein
MVFRIAESYWNIYLVIKECKSNTIIISNLVCFYIIHHNKRPKQSSWLRNFTCNVPGRVKVICFVQFLMITKVLDFIIY